MPSPAPRAPSNGALSALRQAALYGSLGITTGASLLLIEERRRRICICKQIIERGQIVSAYRRHLHNVALANLRNEDPPELPFESPRPHPLSVTEIDKAYARATGQRRRSRIPPDFDKDDNVEPAAALAANKAERERSANDDRASKADQHTSKSRNRPRKSFDGLASSNGEESSTTKKPYPNYGYGYFIPDKRQANDPHKARSINCINREIQEELALGQRLTKVSPRTRRQERWHNMMVLENAKGPKESSNLGARNRPPRLVLSQPRRPFTSTKRAMPLETPRAKNGLSRLRYSRGLVDQRLSKYPNPSRTLLRLKHSITPAFGPPWDSRVKIARLNIAEGQAAPSLVEEATSRKIEESELSEQQAAATQVECEANRKVEFRKRHIANAENLGFALMEFCVWYNFHGPGSFRGDTIDDKLWKRLLPRSYDDEDTTLHAMAIEELKQQDLRQVVDFFLTSFPARPINETSLKGTFLPDLAIVLLELAAENPLKDLSVDLFRRLQEWDCITPSVLQVIRKSVEGLLKGHREDDAFQLLLSTFGTIHTTIKATTLEGIFDEALQMAPEKRQDNNLLREIISLQPFEDKWRRRVHRAIIEYLGASREEDAVSLLSETSGVGKCQSMDKFFYKASKLSLDDQKSNPVLQGIISAGKKFEDTWMREVWRRCQELRTKNVAVIEEARLFTATKPRYVNSLQSRNNTTHHAMNIAVQGKTEGSAETVLLIYEWIQSMRRADPLWIKSNFTIFPALLAHTYANNGDYGLIFDLFRKHDDDPKFVNNTRSIRPAVCSTLAESAPYPVAVESITSIIMTLKNTSSDDSVYETCLLTLPKLLRRCWQETRNMSSVETLAQDITTRSLLGSALVPIISREMINIRRSDLTDIEAASPSEWNQQEPDALGDMMVVLARKAQWHTLEKVLEDAYRGGLLASIPMFSDSVFNFILEEHAKNHGSLETQRFVMQAIETYHFVPNQKSLVLVLEALIKDARVNAIPEWVQYLSAKGFHITVTTNIIVRMLRRFFLTYKPPHAVLAQMTDKLCSIDEGSRAPENMFGWIDNSKARHRRGLNSAIRVPEDMYGWLDNSKSRHRRGPLSSGILPLLQASMAFNLKVKREGKGRRGLKEFETRYGPRVLKDDSIQEDDLAGLTVKETRVEDDLVQLEKLAKESLSLSTAERTQRQLAAIHQLAEKSPPKTFGLDLETGLTLDLNQGKNEEVMSNYTRLLDQGLLGSQLAMETAVEAAARESGGDASKAAPILQKARDLGMDVRRAQSPVLHHHIISSKMSPREIHSAVSNSFRNRSDGNLTPPLYLAVVAAHHLIHRMKPHAAVMLLTDVYLSSWAKDMPVDIRFMTVFLDAYGKIGNLRGIQWVVQNLLDSDMRLDRHFIDILKQARFRSKKRMVAQALQEPMLEDRLESLNSIFRPWLDDCEARLWQQHQRTRALGQELVRVIAKLMKPVARGKIRRTRAGRTVPRLKDLYARRRKQRERMILTGRKRAGKVVRLVRTVSPPGWST